VLGRETEISRETGVRQQRGTRIDLRSEREEGVIGAVKLGTVDALHKLAYKVQG